MCLKFVIKIEKSSFSLFFGFCYADLEEMEVFTELPTVFDADIKEKVIDVHKAIPGSLTKYLQERQIVKHTEFCNDFDADRGPMGTETCVNFVDFEQTFRDKIHNFLKDSQVTEINAEDLSSALSEEYKTKVVNRPNAGKSVSNIITLDKTITNKTNTLWTQTHVHLYLYLVEECEKNLIRENQRRFRYSLTIRLRGFSLDANKALMFCQALRDGTVEQVINKIRTLAPIRFEDI